MASEKTAKGFMAYKIGDKTIGEYINMARMPIYALIALDIINYLVTLLIYLPGYALGLALAAGSISMLISLLQLIIAGYIGYIIVKNYSGDLMNAAWGGGLAGAISGLAGAILGVIVGAILLTANPIYGGALLAASLVGIIIGTIVGAIVGAILAVIGGLIAGARTFGQMTTAQTAKR